MSIMNTDRKMVFFEGEGFTVGSVQDREQAWLLSKVTTPIAKGIDDLWMQLYTQLGITIGSVQDREAAFFLLPGVSGTAQAGTSNTLTLAANAPSILLPGTKIALLSAAGSVQERPVSTYNGGTKVGLVSPRWRTNLLKWSEAFDNASWSKINVTVTADQEADPDGAITADKLTGAASSSRAEQGFSAGASTTYSFSVWVKYASGSATGQIKFSDNVANELRASTDWSLGTITPMANIGGATISSVDVEAYPNGWFRYTIVGTTHDSATTYQISVVIGNGTNVFAWGAQVEQPSPGDYIKTEAAAITLPDATTGYEVTDK